MDFLKKVILYSVAYFVVVLLWILMTEQMLDPFLLTIQSICFGIVVSGYLSLIYEKNSSFSESLGLKDKKEEED
jgi:hypothetical protein